MAHFNGPRTLYRWQFGLLLLRITRRLIPCSLLSIGVFGGAAGGDHLSRHVVAGLGAAAADPGAVDHHLVVVFVAQALAVVGAALADLGAGAAGGGMELRAADHEV